MKKKYLLFDLDGTITASDEGITKCVAYALSHFGIKVDDLSQLKPFVGPPLREAFPRYYGLSQADTETAVKLYRERYSEIGIFECYVYDGIPELLKKCREAGFVSVLATSKPRVYANRILEKYGIAEYFSHVVGCELDGTLDKKSEIIQYALSLYPNEDKSRFIMIGDRFYDIEGAQSQGIESIGVLYGYGSWDELTKAHANYICEDVNSLYEMITSLA